MIAYFTYHLYYLKGKERKEMTNSRRFSKYVVSLLLFLLFEAVAITLWLAKGNLFYLLNFSYIGVCLGIGTAPGNDMPAISYSWRWETICFCISASSPARICRSKGSGTTCSSAYLRRRRSTMRLQKSLDLCCSGAAGAATPAGRQCCWIFCLISSHRNRERESWAFCAI